MKLNLFSAASLAIFAVAGAQAQLAGNWPTPDVAVQPVAEWTRRINVAGATLAPIVETCRSTNEWGISFDDGPSDQTPRVLALLRERGITATFFVVGSRVIQRPEVLRQIHAAGHQIALHTWSHADLSTLNEAQILAELMWNMKAVQDAIGVTPTYFRPPYGAVNDVVRRVAGALGLTIITWTRDSEDWKAVTDPSLVPSVLSNVRTWAADKSRGIIFLQHDLHAAAVNIAGDILSAIAGAGNRMMPVGTCAGATNAQWYRTSLTDGNVTPGTTGGVGTGTGSGGTGTVSNNTVGGSGSLGGAGTPRVTNTVGSTQTGTTGNQNRNTTPANSANGLAISAAAGLLTAGAFFFL